MFTHHMYLNAQNLCSIQSKTRVLPMVCSSDSGLQRPPHHSSNTPSTFPPQSPCLAAPPSRTSDPQIKDTFPYFSEYFVITSVRPILAPRVPHL